YEAMRISLFISLFANCLLAVALLWIAARPRATLQRVVNERADSTVQVVAASTEPATISVAGSPGGPKGAKFTWGQVESADYPTYIANLRSIGCPEPTIKDIIAADVHALYLRKRQELGRTFIASASAQVARLDADERSLIAT